MMNNKFREIIVFSLIMIGTFSHSASSESVLDHWNNEKEMGLYYEAISKFRNIFEQCLAEEGGAPYVQNGFKDWPCPNPFHYRSRDHLFLEMHEQKYTDSSDSPKKLYSLYTPFGQVMILGAGDSDLIKKISKNILTEMKDRWVLEEVTEKIKCYRFFFSSAKGKTSTGWFFGMKLHMIFNTNGDLVRLAITPGNVNDRTPVRSMVKGMMTRLIGDKGYLSQTLFNDLFQNGVTLITKIKRNMKNKLMGMGSVINFVSIF